MIFSKILEVRGTKMKKIQKNAARFDNLKQDFLDDKKYSGTAEATLNGYRYDITRFLKFLSDEQLAVNEVGFKRYVIHLTDSGMTANSINHYIRSVKVFLYWCMEQDEIEPNRGLSDNHKPNRFTRIERKRKMPAHCGDSTPSVGGHSSVTWW